MSESSFQIRQVRVDIPLQRGHAYLFVSPEEALWGPWWQSFYDYLLKLAPSQPNWHFEPVEGHRTLRRAAELPVSEVSKLELMFFAGRAS